MNLSDIKSSLSKGKLFTGRSLILLYICLFIFCVFPIITLCILISSLIEKNIWSENQIYIFVVFNVFSLFAFGITLWILIKNKKLKEDIKNWLKDCVELNAFVTRLDIINPEYKPYQVKIEFSFNGKKHSKNSNPGNAIIGYKKTYMKYVDKNIVILYSPKYDEVLFIKNK